MSFRGVANFTHRPNSRARHELIAVNFDPASEELLRLGEQSGTGGGRNGWGAVEQLGGTGTEATPATVPSGVSNANTDKKLAKGSPKPAEGLVRSGTLRFEDGSNAGSESENSGGETSVAPTNRTDGYFLFKLDESSNPPRIDKAGKLGALQSKGGFAAGIGRATARRSILTQSLEDPAWSAKVEARLGISGRVAPDSNFKGTQ